MAWSGILKSPTAMHLQNILLPLAEIRKIMIIFVAQLRETNFKNRDENKFNLFNYNFQLTGKCFPFELFPGDV